MHEPDLACRAQVPERDMATTVAALVARPHHEVEHAQYGTLMRMMDREEPFGLFVAASRP